MIEESSKVSLKGKSTLTKTTDFKNQAIVWITACTLLVLFVWLFRPVLLPFVVGATIAYLLNPVVVALGKRRLSRIWATILILSLFMISITVLAVLILPPLYRELVQLAEAAPGYVDTLWEYLQPYLRAVQQRVGEDGLDQSIRDLVKNNISNALGAGSSLLDGLMSGGRALLSLFSFLAVTPLVAFFVMLEWPGITKWIDDVLPRHSYDESQDLLLKIDRKIAGFVRGQLLVAISLGVLYAVALSIVGLEFGFLIGVAAGLLSVIPLFGSIVGLLASVVVAWFQSGEIGFVGLVAAIFLAGQFLEGNVITPKLVGKSVGLHPLWILFSLMAGGALFGIVGMMLAVPVAASIGVLTSFALERYKDSGYYQSGK